MMEDYEARSRAPWAIVGLIGGLIAGAGVGFMAGAYPIPGAGTYVLPSIRSEVMDMGKPSDMDVLFARSVTACKAYSETPSMRLEGGRMRFGPVPKIGTFLDDAHIVGTNERQFAGAVCKAYEAGRSFSLMTKDYGITVIRRGAYDEPLN